VNGVLAAVVSSALGGSAAALTRYAIAASDPVTLAAFRFGIGFVLFLPLALVSWARWACCSSRCSSSCTTSR
jgi:drug/metabolite transporter (DMT)-like permease